MSTRASGTFEVSLIPATSDTADAFPGRLILDKRFQGDLVATSQGQMLSVLTPTQGSAGYVAIERVSGTLHGRNGTFVLQHNGLMDRGAPQLSIVVVPDSGTDELTGLSGHMTIHIDEGHRYELDYERSGDAVALPDAPAVPGLAFRRFRGPDDYAKLTAVINASNEADGDEWVASAEEIGLWFEHVVNTDLARDMLIAEIDGEPVGLVHGHWRVEVSGLYRYQVMLWVAPAGRGQGIRRTMLRWLEARLRRVAAEHPAGAPKEFAITVTERAEDTRALFESQGYSGVRYYHRMVRPLDEPIPDFPMPPGLELRPVLPEHHRAIWEASDEAFRDHWGASPRPEAYFDLWRNDPVTFQPALWQIAWDTETDEVAGQVQTFIDAQENEKFGRRRGYSETISVRRPYRRRGLARALIAESLRTLQAQGMTEAALFVDAENVSGATRLYEDCGFVTQSRSVAYRKPLDPH